jgi:hypothetical protein
MGVHLYDQSPNCPLAQHERLRPARVLADAGVPFIVWGEDALSFAFFVPTCLFDFHILIPDECVDAAVKALLEGLPCRRMDAPPERWTELTHVDASRPPCFPNSSWLQTTSRTLKNEPETIVVHPQSWFAFDVRDATCSTTLSPSFSPEDAKIRFPTLPALLDSLIATILDPPIGYRHRRTFRMLNCWIGYLFVYTPVLRFPSDLETPRLEPRQEVVVNAMKQVEASHPFRCFRAHCCLKENRSYFMVYMNGKLPSWQQEVHKRRELMRKMG